MPFKNRQKVIENHIGKRRSTWDLPGILVMYQVLTIKCGHTTRKYVGFFIFLYTEYLGNSLEKEQGT